jgi:hypothetical protein
MGEALWPIRVALLVVVHITFMTRFTNRLTALLRWFLSLAGTGRFERPIVVGLDQLLGPNSVQCGGR